jgi:DNA-binding CsgD family transcriptional regulator
MSRADAILQVTERLYAAVTAPEQWRPALESVIDLLNGGHGTLDVLAGAGRRVATARLDERDLAAVITPDAMRMAAPLVAAVPLGISDRQALISDDDFARSAFYNEYVRPLGGFHSLQVRDSGTGGGFLLTVCRPQQAEHFERSDTDVLQAIAPHLSTALMLQARLQASDQRGAALAFALDRLSTAVILTDGAARPFSLNARAERVVAEVDGLALDPGGLAAATPAATHALRMAIAELAQAGVGERRLRLLRPSRRLPLLLTLMPISRFGLSGAARVAVFISEPDAPVALDHVALADTFRLTRRESEIAAELARGHDLGTIAARLGLGLGTVRNHLKRMFDKTGTRSQPALVALLRGFADRTN